METNYTWDDLKSYFAENPKHTDVSEKLIREGELTPDIKKETCRELSGLIFRIDWDNTPEGRDWWYAVYLDVLEEDRKLEQIQV